MPVVRTASGADSALERARAVAPLAASLAERAESERRLPSELVDALAAAGMFRLLVPASLGGGEVSPLELVDCVSELARADGTTGWCVAVAATSGAIAGYLPEDHAREVYADPARCWGGVFAPKGRAVLDGETLTVTGRWPFATGIDHCDWLMGGCMVEERGQARTGEGGRPDLRLVLFPASAAERIDTWDVSGLRGTGSHDMEVSAVTVPAGRSVALHGAPAREPGPLYAFPVFGTLAAAIAAVGLGIARGAVDDLLDLAGAKVPTLSTRTLAARPDTQSRVAAGEARLRAAGSLLREELSGAWEEASAGAVGIERRAAIRLAATHAMSESAAVTAEMYSLGGGSAIYASSPLQRRFRDAHVATQHMLVGRSTLELAGRLLLGVPADTDML